MHGILWYSFGNFKLLPRNNFDIVNLSVPVDTNGCNIPTNVSLTEVAVAEISVFPNPARETFTIASSAGELNFRLMDLNGRVITSSSDAAMEHEVNVENLVSGVYVLTTIENKTGAQKTHKIVVRH